MAVVSIATLKSYFNTGDVPTESQYTDLIDTLASLSAILGVSGNTGGNNLTSPDGNSYMNIGDGSFNIEVDNTGTSSTSFVSGDGSMTKMFYDLLGSGGYASITDLLNTIQHTVSIKLDAPVINIAQIPTSDSGLSAGDVWSNGGVLTIV